MLIQGVTGSSPQFRKRNRGAKQNHSYLGGSFFLSGDTLLTVSVCFANDCLFRLAANVSRVTGSSLQFRKRNRGAKQKAGAFAPAFCLAPLLYSTSDTLALYSAARSAADSLLECDSAIA